MDKLTISRILVENKYLLPVTKADTGVHVVDIPKAAEVLNELFQQKLKQCNVSGALPLNVAKATELAQIGSKYIYEDALGYGRISEGGVFEIIKKYEEFKRQ